MFDCEYCCATARISRQVVKGEARVETPVSGRLRRCVQTSERVVNALASGDWRTRPVSDRVS